MAYWDPRYAVHHINGDFWNQKTTCGLAFSFYQQGVYDSWRGVTCKRCKATKKRAATKPRSKAR